MEYLLRRLAVAGSFFCLVALGRAEERSTEAPLPENYFPVLKILIDSAVKQSPRMIARNAEEAVAENNRVIARAGQLPTVGGYFSYFPLDRQSRLVQVNGHDTHDVGNIQKIGYNFSLSQPLFYWGALRNTTRIAELQQKITQGQTAESYRLLVNEIRAQFLQLVIKNASLVRTRFNRKLVDDQLELARSKLTQHVIAPSDMFGPQIYAEQAHLATERQEEDFASAKTAFAKLTGAPVLTDAQIPDAIPRITPASAELQSRLTALTTRSDFETFALKNLRQQIEIEKLNYAVTKTRLRPKLSATIGSSQDQQHYAGTQSPYQVRDDYVGLSLSWSIFDGFATARSKANSLVHRRELERAYHDQTEDQITAIKAQARQLDFSARNLAIVEKFLEAAEAGLHGRQEDVTRGLSSEADVSAAQLAFYDSQLSAFGARSEYLMGVAGLLSSMLEDPALSNLSSK